ncbi:MAG TPA: trypsin-like peptidase domain-containing protein [Pyrinomonadaceae bacterium]|nr:trypsin-like peptidase domain-containing protein [Pyrinomonadaceae bacterium]
MPIPDDHLQRWWVEVATENPHLVDQFRPVLLAFLAFGPGRKASLAGTGFIIAGNLESALVITAKHVLTEGVGRAQTPWTSHAPTALFVKSGVPMLTLDPKKLKLVWAGSHHAEMLNAGHVGYNDTLDVACCVVTPQEGELLGFQPSTVPIDIEVPLVGERVHMVSLSGMTINERVPPTAPSGGGHALEIKRGVSIRIGVVTGVYPGGLRHYRWPCFTTSIPAEPGMSGGFVTRPRDGKTVAACGIVCADSSADEARTNYLQCGESIIACAWPSLGLRVPEVMSSDPATPTLTLYEMMRAGRMDTAIGGIERIEVVERENRDCSISIR